MASEGLAEILSCCESDSYLQDIDVEKSAYVCIDVKGAGDTSVHSTSRHYQPENDVTARGKNLHPISTLKIIPSRHHGYRN